MKFNPYLEWYNTLLLYGYPDFSNASYVAKTLDLWLNEIPDKDLEKAIHKTEINLLCPTLIQEDEQPDQFAWQLIHLLFDHQCRSWCCRRNVSTDSRYDGYF